MDERLVSIVIPVYRVAPGLFTRCVESAAAQTEKRIEILLVFDGTREIYKEALKAPVFGDERVRMVSIHHRGVSAARNAGLEAAAGKWIFFADADDCLERDGVEQLLSKADEKTDLVAGDYSIRYGEKEELHRYRKRELKISREERQEFLEDVLNPQSGMGFCWAKLYRREFLNAHGLRFREELEVAEDAEFVLKCAMYAGEIRYLPRKVYSYRIHSNSAVRRFRADYAARYEKGLRSISDTIREAGYEERLQDAYQVCVLYHLLLITVNDSFRPDGRKSGRQQIADYKRLVRTPLYAEALKSGSSRRFSLTRRVSVLLIRLHFWQGIRGVAWLRHKQLKF